VIATLLVLAPLAGEIQVLRHDVDFQTAARRNAYVEGRPALRGFRAMLGADAAQEWPIEPPAGDGDLARAAELVNSRLARDGLLPTLVRVVDVLDAKRFAGDDQLGLLRQTGLPVDWFAYFTAPGATSVVQFAAGALNSGASVEAAIADLARVQYAFKPTIPGFEVATESGENEIECIRLGIGSDHYYSVEGDGGTVDMPRELLTKIENVAFVASIQSKHLDGFQAIARTWQFARGSTLTLLPQELPVSQWTQDNGKNGIVTVKGARSTATLVPRYASRGEDGSQFVPGETFALEAFAAAGRRIAQSPLLFQGGNMIPVLDPKTSMRQMVVGEAELFRNMSLGLSQAQVLEALRVEFGVERCVVVPATSYHVDVEVTVRALPDGLVAFMSDTSAAARLVVRCAVPALERAGVLDAADVAKIREDIAGEKWPVVLDGLGTLLQRRAVGPGAFPESFAAHFAADPADSGPGNLQRFLLALDVLTAEMSDGASLAKQDLDPHSIAYLTSLRRREVERQMVARVLSQQGFRIVGVPSTSEGALSLNPINGVHAKGVYYMPVRAGLFADFDAAAKAVFEGTFGPSVRVVPIRSGESMRRQGAVHCAVSVLPRS
jgi:hypothetical protein